MDSELFQHLINLISPRTEKKNAAMRDAVSAEGILSVTLRYLATGNSYQDLKFSTAIAPQLLSRIVHDTCTVI
jgi:hypothetical protein